MEKDFTQEQMSSKFSGKSNSDKLSKMVIIVVMDGALFTGLMLLY